MLWAGAALVAVGASFGIVYAACVWFGAAPQAAIVAAILAVSLSRGNRVGKGRHALAAIALLPAVAVAAAGMGWLLQTTPALGAMAFTAAIAGSIWLRNFGEGAQRAGTLIALPLVAMLVVPKPVASGRPLIDLGLLIFAGLVALGSVTAVRAIADRGGPGLRTAEPPRTRPRNDRTHTGPSPQTRMALQMGLALAGAFGIGFLVFPGHWAWTVLTAFIVGSGARGRGDAAYKGILRLVGAAAGTVGAAVVAQLWAPVGAAETGAIFVVLFFGLWLRERNYAYWAASVTLILALLGSSGGVHDVIGLLGVRLAAIVAGALCAVAAAWFVLPIRTEAVIRRRLADALAALDELVEGANAPDAERAGKLALFEYRIAELERVAPPVRWHRRLFGPTTSPEHPARWIELAHELSDRAEALSRRAPLGEREHGAIRRAIGLSRRAIANHGQPDATKSRVTIGAALDTLHAALRAGAAGPT